MAVALLFMWLLLSFFVRTGIVAWSDLFHACHLLNFLFPLYLELGFSWPDFSFSLNRAKPKKRLYR